MGVDAQKQDGRRIEKSETDGRKPHRKGKSLLSVRLLVMEYRKTGNGLHRSPEVLIVRYSASAGFVGSEKLIEKVDDLPNEAHKA